MLSTLNPTSIMTGYFNTGTDNQAWRPRISLFLKTINNQATSFFTLGSLLPRIALLWEQTWICQSLTTFSCSFNFHFLARSIFSNFYPSPIIGHWFLNFLPVYHLLWSPFAAFSIQLNFMVNHFQHCFQSSNSLHTCPLYLTPNLS